MIMKYCTWGKLAKYGARLGLPLIMGLALLISLPLTVQADGITMTFTLNQ